MKVHRLLVYGIIVIILLIGLAMSQIIPVLHDDNVCKAEGYKLAIVRSEFPNVKDGFVLCQVIVYDADGFGVVKYIAVEDEE